jgi:hypothetical protein
MSRLVLDRPSRLPVTVPLVRDETIDSYLFRLARANHLEPAEVDAYLGKRTSTSQRFERLAAITGHPADWLSDLIVTKADPCRQTRRAACRRCTASRGIRTTVRLAAPNYGTICRRHHRWLSGDHGPDRQQYQLNELPEVLTAHRQHLRLVRRLGVLRAGAHVADATEVTRGWTRRDWEHHRDRRLRRVLGPGRWTAPANHPLTAMVNYPETITLARIFASPAWSALAISTRRADILAFHAEVSRRLKIDYEPYTAYDPLLRWQDYARDLARDPETAQLLWN